MVQLPFRKHKSLNHFALVLTLVQIAMGTQMNSCRQLIDLLGEETQAIWLTQLNFILSHRFLLLVTGLNIFIGLARFLTNATSFSRGDAVVTGILMYYFDFPNVNLHLLFASCLLSTELFVIPLFLKSLPNDLSFPCYLRTWRYFSRLRN